jgi:hypothetical protein
MKGIRFLAPLLFLFSYTANAAWFDCTPVEAMSFNSRVHIRCANSTAGIYYFAMPTSNAELADRFLSTSTTALVSGRTAVILYNPNDTSGATWGCATSDCRRAQAIGIR